MVGHHGLEVLEHEQLPAIDSHVFPSIDTRTSSRWNDASDSQMLDDEVDESGEVRGLLLLTPGQVVRQ